MKTFMKFISEKSNESKLGTKESLGKLLSMLRAQHEFYYNAHWKTSGKEFYQMHLLFQRLYESLPEQFDTLGEKLVAYFGKEAIPDSKDTQEWVNKWEKEDLVDSAIASEQELQIALQNIYTNLKKSGDMSLGLDDYLMSLANEHETNLYLLTSIRK